MTEQVLAILKRYREEHGKLHDQWSAQVGTPGYVKQEWMDREEGLIRRYRSQLQALGYSGPMLGYTQLYETLRSVDAKSYQPDDLTLN